MKKDIKQLMMALVGFAMFGMPVSESVGQSFDSAFVFSIANGSPGKPKPLVGPLDPFALVFGVNYKLHDEELEARVPASRLPPIFGPTPSFTTTPNPVFHLKRDSFSDLRIGVRLFSIIEGGPIFKDSDKSTFETTAPADNPYSGEYQTLWGGYEFGNYAAIAKINVRNRSVGWYMQVQTPDINISRRLALQPFAFVSIRESEVDFESGYHRFQYAFNPRYESLELGTIKEIPGRAGLVIRYAVSPEFSIGLVGYAERDFGEFSESARGESFAVKYSHSRSVHPGGGIQLVLRF